MALGCARPFLLRAGELLELRVECGIVGLDRQPLETQAVDLGLGHVGQRFEADLDFGVLARLILIVQLNLGLHRRAQFLVGKELLDPVLDRAGQRIALQRVAVHLADQVGGNLAGAKTGHAHGRRDALDFLVDPRVNILGGDGQRVGPLEACVFRLDGFHDLFFIPGRE